MTDKISNGAKKGFTLIEFMIVAALIIMFSGLTLPVGFNFYQESTLRDQAKNLENSLRKAQAVAMAGRGDSNAGVKIIQEEQQYIVFEGESYEKRREGLDIIIPFPLVLSASGTDEIVFQKSTGLPTFPEEERSIIIIFGASSQEITINSQGKIERHEPTGQ